MSQKTTRGQDFEAWIASHPRQAAQAGFLVAFALWQLPMALLGVVLFILFSQLLRLDWVWLLLGGAIAAAFSLLLWAMDTHFNQSLLDFLQQMRTANLDVFKVLWHEGFSAAFYFLYQTVLSYGLGFAFLGAGILSALDRIPNSTHERELWALQRGKARTARVPSQRAVAAKLAKLEDDSEAGTLLGVSKVSGKAVIVPDKHVNQMLLVLGTTGGGKTITLRRFYQRAILQGYPLIIVDGKPTEENVDWVQAQAAQAKRPFFGFSCGTFDHYDCLAHGGYTELKDKIISLKDEWESEYYRSIAEDYLQTTFEVLLKSGTAFDLQTVVDCLSYDELAVKVRGIDDTKLIARVRQLEAYARKDLSGLQAHLRLLINSEMGHYFTRGERTFSLTDVIAQNGVVYFALPALRFSTFSAVLGKLVINDIKAVIDRVDASHVFTVFDEFSIFAGEQVLNLVNMGRGKGIHAIFGTQGLADLEKVDKSFAKQILNCVNTLICHRLNDQDSAEAVSSWVGTEDSFDLTAQISSEQGSTGMGSVRRNKSFIVHPDEIKQDLQPGEAFYITKVGQFQQDKVKVKYT